MCKWLKLLILLCVFFVNTGPILAEEPSLYAKERSYDLKRIFSSVPSLRIVESVYELSYNSGDLEVMHDFRVQNTGKGVLRINEIAPD